MRKRINMHCSLEQKKAIDLIKQDYSPNFSSFVDFWLNNAIDQGFVDTSYGESASPNGHRTQVYLQPKTVERLEEHLLKYFCDRRHKSKFIKSLILSGQCREKVAIKKSVL